MIQKIGKSTAVICFGLWLISLGAGAYIISSAITLVVKNQVSQPSPKTHPAKTTLDDFCEAWEAREAWEVTHCDDLKIILTKSK